MAAVPLDGALPVCDRTERIRHAVSLRRTDMSITASVDESKSPEAFSSFQPCDHFVPHCRMAPLYRIRICLSRPPCAASAYGLRPVLSPSQRPAWSLRSKGLATLGALPPFPRAARGVNSNSTLAAPFPPRRPFVLPTLPPTSHPLHPKYLCTVLVPRTPVSALSCCSSSAAYLASPPTEPTTSPLAHRGHSPLSALGIGKLADSPFMAPLETPCSLSEYINPPLALLCSRSFPSKPSTLDLL